MLVHRYDDYSRIQHWSYVFLSEKYDGWRMVWNHLTNTFTTRTGKILQVPEYFYTEIKQLQIDYDLDGEYWGGYGMFTKIAEHTETTEMYFKVYDIIDVNLAFEQRHQILSTINVSLKSHIHIVQHIRIDQTMGTIDAIIRQQMNTIVAKGGEGVVVRNPDALYTTGNRSYDILKLKPVEYTELIVMGHHVTEEKKLINDYVSSLICYTEDGDDLRITWGNCKQKAPVAHSIIRIKFSQLTVAGIPKFPSYIGTINENNIDPAQLQKFNNLKTLSHAHTADASIGLIDQSTPIIK